MVSFVKPDAVPAAKPFSRSLAEVAAGDPASAFGLAIEKNGTDRAASPARAGFSLDLKQYPDQIEARRQACSLQSRQQASLSGSCQPSEARDPECDRREWSRKDARRQLM